MSLQKKSILHSFATCFGHDELHSVTCLHYCVREDKIIKRDVTLKQHTKESKIVNRNYVIWISLKF